MKPGRTQVKLHLSPELVLAIRTLPEFWEAGQLLPKAIRLVIERRLEKPCSPS